MKVLRSVIDMLSYIAAARNLGDDGSGSSALIAPDCHATFSYTNQTCIPRRQEPQGLTFPDTSNDADSSHLQKGGMVELYGDGSYFATPAIITGYNKEKPSTKYNLHNSITNQHHSGVDPEFIHPYQVYEDGTEAACNVGALRKIYMTPCTIDSHFIKGSGLISYQVSYLNDFDVQVQEYLPFARVQRNLPAHP
mmetsp:Transcript_34880/g.62786  ORF Transcript_34880/g.62786 Transcript_34880/m.62786 type:complete len:194 (+) Transcript_34880:171-752(+)